MGDWVGDPDVTLGWGRLALWDGGKYAVGAELRWSGVRSAGNFQVHGADGLIDRLPGAKGPHLNRVPAAVDETVLATH